jgi:hypothetical protein
MTREGKMSKKYFILGASDPEIGEIERLIRARSDCVVGYATAQGSRVRPESAYEADSVQGFDLHVPCDVGGLIVAVECGPRPGADWAWVRTGLVPGSETEVDCAAVVVTVDHHRPGDPGYGRPPREYLEASSLGQVLHLLELEPTPEQRLIAAADHCLAAAYRGECPGVDPDALMTWRAASRAVFQKRAVREVLADIEAARAVLRSAPQIELAPGVWAADLRGRKIPELPEASAREGICFLADGLPLPDGRVKVVCQSGGPEQIRAFMEEWAPSQGLTGIYGDPARGFAGGYLTPAG